MNPLLLLSGMLFSSWHPESNSSHTTLLEQVTSDTTQDRGQQDLHFVHPEEQSEPPGGHQDDPRLLEEAWLAGSQDSAAKKSSWSSLRENFEVVDNYVDSFPPDREGALTVSGRDGNFWSAANEDPIVRDDENKEEEEDENILGDTDFEHSDDDLTTDKFWWPSPEDNEARERDLATALDSGPEESDIPGDTDHVELEDTQPKVNIEVGNTSTKVNVKKTQNDRWAGDAKEERRRKRKQKHSKMLKETLQEELKRRKRLRRIKNSKEKTSPPNIIFILADDLGYNDVPWHNPDMKAPEILRLARKGILLENHYVLPLCAPSRAALLTGLYPFRYGKQASATPLSPTGLNTSLTLLPQRLKTLGYKTHLIGKWHLGYCSWSYTPTHRGFDSFYGYYLGSQTYFTRYKKLFPKKGSPFWSEQNEVVSDLDPPRRHAVSPKQQQHLLKLQHQLSEEGAGHDPPGGRGGQEWLTPEHMEDGGYDFRFNQQPINNVSEIYSNDLYAARAEEVIKEHVSRSPSDPLFLLLSLQAVHGPVEVPLRYRRMHRGIMNLDRRTFHGMVTAMDEVVGRVVRQLKKSGLYDNSLIVFTSDNGGNVRAGGNNFPLRGNKGSMFEGGVRGVAFIHSPLLPRTGYKYTGLMHMVDWHDTLMHVASGDIFNKHQQGQREHLSSRSEDHFPMRTNPTAAGEEEEEEEEEEAAEGEEVEEVGEWEGDGMNMWSAILKNGKSPRISFVYNLRKRPLRGAIRHKNWKLVVGGGGRYDGWVPPTDVSGGANTRCCSSWHARTPTHNLMLYNLKDDPLETTDVADLRPDMVATLKARLRDYALQSREPHSPRDDPRGHPSLHGGFFSPGWCQPLV